MKKTKKVNYIYITFGMVFISLLMNSTMSLAWPNPNLLSTNFSVGGSYISAYRSDYLNNPNTLRQYYATHDWVAESALEILYSRTTHPFLTKLWNINDPDNLRIWYLFGTELPDTWYINPIFKTSCEAYFRPEQFRLAGHNVLRFDPGGGYPIDDSAAGVASIFYSQIKQSFQKKDCQRAALFLGALMHIICDATYYGHLMDGPSDHIPIYAHLHHVTFRTWTDVGGSRSNEFFNINEALNKITSADLDSKASYLTPDLATLYAGIDTYYGIPGFREANFLYNNRPLAGSNSGDHKFWEDVEGYWTGYSQEDDWDHSNRPINGPVTGPAAYFNTLEHNLNIAIYYCTHAINYILNKIIYNGCGCTGENPPPGGQNPPVGDDVKDKVGVKIALDEFQALFFLGAVGLASTMISLTLMNKMLGIIEKMIPVW